MRYTSTAPFDGVDFLETPGEMPVYLKACIQDANGDATFIAKAIGDIAGAKGMTQMTVETGLSRERIYKAISGETPPVLIRS